MKLNYVKDAAGNTVAVQIPVSEYERIDPFLSVLASESEKDLTPELSASRSDLSSFFELRNLELESRLPDLNQLMAEDREDRI